MKKTSKKTVKKTIGRNRTNKKDAVPETKTKPATKSLPDIHGNTESKKTALVMPETAKNSVDAVFAAMTKPVEESRGGLRDASEARAKTVQEVRAEFLSDTFRPKITLAFKTITFNTSCVNLFPEGQYVVIRIDEENLRLIVEPATYYDRNCVKFANSKGGKIVPRLFTTKHFCQELFGIMKWNPNAKYRILTVYQVFEGKKYLVFNLDEAQQVFSDTTEGEDGKKKRNTTVYMPVEWKGRFGYVPGELEEKTRIKYSSTLLTIDHKTGERQVSNIEPKPPTAEELIHEPYGGIRPQKKETKNDD